MDKFERYIHHDNVGCLNARRFMGGFAFIFARAMVAYRAKRVSTLCTSSTEAEFITAVNGFKTANAL